MSTPTQPTNTATGTYSLSLGGTLIMPSPLPDVIPYPLRPDQFLTFCEGEMSVSRSLRDACIGAFATGVVGLAGILLTIEWASAEKQGRHPLFWTILLSTLVGVALLGGVVEWIRMMQTRTKSSYSRLVRAIAEYFNIEVPS